MRPRALRSDTKNATMMGDVSQWIEERSTQWKLNGRLRLSKTVGRPNLPLVTGIQFYRLVDGNGFE